MSPQSLTCPTRSRNFISNQAKAFRSSVSYKSMLDVPKSRGTCHAQMPKIFFSFQFSRSLRSCDIVEWVVAARRCKTARFYLRPFLQSMGCSCHDFQLDIAACRVATVLHTTLSSPLSFIWRAHHIRLETVVRMPIRPGCVGDGSA